MKAAVPITTTCSIVLTVQKYADTISFLQGLEAESEWKPVVLRHPFVNHAFEVAKNKDGPQN